MQKKYLKKHFVHRFPLSQNGEMINLAYWKPNICLTLAVGHGSIDCHGNHLLQCQLNSENARRTVSQICQVCGFLWSTVLLFILLRLQSSQAYDRKSMTEINKIFCDKGNCQGIDQISAHVSCFWNVFVRTVFDCFTGITLEVYNLFEKRKK